MEPEKKVEEKHDEKIIEAVKEEETVKKMHGGMCNKNTKMAIIVAALLIIVALGFYFRGSFIAATVNGSPISRFDVIREAEKQSGKTILDNLIIKKIIANEAAKKKVTVTKADITAEIKKLEDQLKTQSLTLEQALTEQGMTRAALEEQIILQKQVEKMVPKSDPITDEVITKYMIDNKISVPKAEEAAYRDQIKKQMEQQAFSEAAQKMVEELKNKATVKYLINY